MNSFVVIFEMIGTVAFALSGALKASQFDLDLFGIIIMGVTTATGGGIFRDMILGKLPPSAFVDPVYVATAAGTSIAVFLFLCIIQGTSIGEKQKHLFDQTLLVADSLGLGIFTVMGTMSAYQMYPEANSFLYIFSGVVTGVGGGMLRDVILRCLPDIFTKYIYASACIVGAIVEIILMDGGNLNAGLWIGAALVFMIRMYAAIYRWSLPKVPKIR